MRCATNDQLLDHYGEKQPRKLFQFDGFKCDGRDHIFSPDEDGHSIMGCITCELMNSPFSVRVLVADDADDAEVVALLLKTAAWIERKGTRRIFDNHAAEPTRLALRHDDLPF